MPRPHSSAERVASLAKIHIARKDLSLDEATYRDMLWSVARVRSAADLDYAGRRAVLEHLRARGWQARRRQDAGAPRGARPMLQKIGALLAEQGLPWSYATGIARQMYRRPLEWLRDSELRSVIAALHRRGARQAEAGA